MKFRVTFKDPDGPHDSIRDAARESLADIKGLSEREQEVLLEEREERLREFAYSWFSSGEYCTVELDTDANTATVIKRG